MKALVLVFAGGFASLAWTQTFERVPLDFRHQASKTSQKHLIETMGAGVALLDYDGDGLLDLYFVNGASLFDPEHNGEPVKSDPRYWNRLYRNLGGWRFEDVTEKAGVAGDAYGMGVAVADFDNDGDSDLFLTNYGPDILYRNRGDGTFANISRNAGVDGEGWSSGAAFLDFDRDGLLDLFVARYLDWTLERSPACGDFLPDRRSYCHPRLFDAVSHRLYRNNGGGEFSDFSERVGLRSRPGKGLGVALGDYDDDGWIDIFIANDSAPQQLFRNVGGRRLQDVAVDAGVAYDADGRTFAGMGVSWTDYDGDGRADILVNALARQGYWIYRNSGLGFEPASEISGLAALSGLSSGWGVGLADFDNDGWRDLFVAQGHVMDDIADSDPGLAYLEPFMLARNLFGRFYDASRRSGAVFESKFAARGAAFGDIDADGLIDVVVSANDNAAVVLRNTTRQSGNSFTLRLTGDADNRDAIGAVVTVRASNGVEQRVLRSPAGSYLSSNAGADLHFGLGSAACCESINIRWADGSEQKITSVAADSLRIRQTTN